MIEIATRDQAVLVMTYVESWLSVLDGDWGAPASAYLREHMGEMADQMVEDHCATEDSATERGRQTVAKTQGPYIDIYQDEAGQFRWRAIAANGANIANGSEGYSSEANAKRAWKRTATLIVAGLEMRNSETPDGEADG